MGSANFISKKVEFLNTLLPPQKGSLLIVAHWDLLRTQVTKALQLKPNMGQSTVPIYCFAYLALQIWRLK